jgi:curved DNA-binding protein
LKNANTNNPKAEEVFKEISEAYSVLGDEKRKAEYDMRMSGGNEHSNNETTYESNNTYTRQKKNMSENDFRNMGSTFENFFGFDPKSSSPNFNPKDKDVKPMKTTDAYNKIFGFRK